MTRRGGAFVVVIGPDGVGKTTLASRLIDDHGPPTLYIHFRPQLWKKPPVAPRAVERQLAKKSDPGFPLFGWLRLTRSFVAFWLGYLRWIRPAVRAGALVVGDRWAYGYIGQPQALGFAGPLWMARLAVRLVPRPDLLIRLKASPDLITSRKLDLDKRQVMLEERAWDALPIPTWELDASRQVSRLASQVAKRLADSIP